MDGWITASVLIYLNTSICDVIFCSCTIAGRQVVLDISVEVPTHAAGPTHELWAEFDVDGAAAALPGQGEARLLRHQHVLRDLLQQQVVDAVRKLQARHTPS